MSTTARRAPLASIPNATNSPHRTLANSTSKRPRAQVDLCRQETEPPQKRQMVEKNVANDTPTTPRRQIPQSTVEGRVFENGKQNASPNAFQKKLFATAHEKESNIRIPKDTNNAAERDAENIRQWQKHYRKVFPSFNFYFDAIPEDVRARLTRHIVSLGAHEERFFSKAVTHIITTRPIPREPEISDPSTAITISQKGNSTEGQLQTIDPTLLEKTNTSALSATRGNTAGQNTLSSKREGSNSNTMDILMRGRQMGMKIWAAEKLQRMIVSLLEDSAPGYTQRTTSGTLNTSRTRHDDLSRVLRDEKLGIASEKDHTSWFRDVIEFKGPFIYIHDMDEKVRPTMIREYPKVSEKRDGEWPQFRSAAIGKCPFVEDPGTKRDIEHERVREKEKERVLNLHKERKMEQTTQTKDTVVANTSQMEPPRRTSPRKALQEVRNFTAGPILVEPVAVNKPLGPPKTECRPSFLPLNNRNATDIAKPLPMQFGGEPAASGIQRSNLTSAIQSQMISSTAASAGAKAATSKEVHELKRKVLERSHTGSLSIGSIPSSHRMNDLTSALKNARAPAPQRAAKSKAQEKLGGIQEEHDPYDEELAAEKVARVSAKTKKQQPTKRDPKPGYCENCRDKYEDFEEHIVSRKHRKFAMTNSNWADLDELLAKLQRP